MESSRRSSRITSGYEINDRGHSLRSRELKRLLLIVLAAVIVRVFTLWIGKPEFTGWLNHTYYYFVQVRGLLADGTLPLQRHADPLPPLCTRCEGSDRLGARDQRRHRDIHTPRHDPRAGVDSNSDLCHDQKHAGPETAAAKPVAAGFFSPHSCR